MGAEMVDGQARCVWCLGDIGSYLRRLLLIYWELNRGLLRFDILYRFMGMAKLLG